MQRAASASKGAMAAVLGGCQSLHTNSKDEALALPSEDSAKTALRTQQVIAYESGIADTADALAGSYIIEELTDKIEAGVWEYLEKIENLGGELKETSLDHLYVLLGALKVLGLEGAAQSFMPRLTALKQRQIV